MSSSGQNTAAQQPSNSTIPAVALAAAQAAVTSSLVSLSLASQTPSQTTTSEQDQGNDNESSTTLQTIEESGDSGIVTIFDSATEFTVKHPLSDSWTLWFDNPNKPPVGSSSGGGHDWLDVIKEVITFSSVEAFWGLYNNILPPSCLPQKANYYLFKKGIRPAWEDKANEDGGKWSLQMPRGKNQDRIDQDWLNMMLAAIGETYEPLSISPTEEKDDLITGVVLNVRLTFFRLNIWTRYSSAEYVPRIKEIGRHFKTDVLGYKIDHSFGTSLSSEIEFVSHKDSEKKGKKGQRLVI